VIFHERDDRPRSKQVKADIFDAYFHVYNLISIFLTTSEIKAFIEVLNAADPEQLDDSLLKLGAHSTIQRKYYIVGSVASGKTSTIDALRCFTTFEEFRGRIPAEMYQDDNTLTEKEQGIVDEYLFPALIAKNRNMRQSHSGIRIMDRAFLDLFAFSKNGDAREVKRKATELKERVRKHRAPLENGHIFFLQASPDALEERLLKRGSRKAAGGKTGFEAETLNQQEKFLSKIYPKTDAMDTSDLSPGEVARKIAREILLGNYREFDFSTRLDEIIAQDGQI
jgi:predicted ATPase